MLGRYVYQDETSDKFWDCLADSSGTYLTRWGRRGTKGQQKIGLQEWKALEMLKEKTRKGYVKDESFTITCERDELEQTVEAVMDSLAPPKNQRMRM